jgi:uncharacterized membrane protein
MEYELPGWFIGKIMDAVLFHRAFERTVRKYNANFKTLAEMADNR